jgi:hypothetical protein
MARLRLLDGRDDLARPIIERARAVSTTGPWRYPVLKELASLDAGERRYSEALEALGELEASGDPYWVTMAESARAEVRAARAQWWLMIAVLAALAATCGLRATSARRRGVKLWAPPFEVIATLPLMIIVGVAAAARHGPEGRTILEMVIGGVALLWVTGVALSNRTFSTGRRALELLIAAFQLAGLFYCVLVANGLTSKAIDTLIIAFVQ